MGKFQDWTSAEMDAISELLSGNRTRVEDHSADAGPFELPDMFSSRTADAHDINNEPKNGEIDNLLRLISFLNAVNSQIGKVEVLSAYRNKELNAKVGGSRRSVHMQGRAADIRVKGMSNSNLAWRLIELGADKVILENLSLDGWCHVEIHKLGKKPRGIKVTAYKNKKGRVLYAAGFKSRFGIYA